MVATTTKNIMNPFVRPERLSSTRWQAHKNKITGRVATARKVNAKKNTVNVLMRELRVVHYVNVRIAPTDNVLVTVLRTSVKTG
jgi:hypothetical protein